jgi:hypothetical protein
MKRILLQSFETGFYLDSAGAWTSSPALARDFPSTVLATEFKVHRHLKNAFVVVVPEPTSQAECAAPPRTSLPGLERFGPTGSLKSGDGDESDEKRWVRGIQR